MKIKTLWCSLLLPLLIQPSVQSAPVQKPLSKLEATELLCAAARGPLGSMTILLEASRLDKTDHKQLNLIKMLHYFVLIANDSLAIYNRNQEHHWHEYIRLAHDISYACSTANSLRKSQTSVVELSYDDQAKENLFREKVRFFLPLLESAGAIYVAHSSNDQSPDTVHYRSLAQGFISLAHYLNEYLRTQNTTLNRVELGLMATTCLLCFFDLQDNHAKKMRLEEERVNREREEEALRQKEQAQRQQEEKKQREESVRKKQEQLQRELEVWNRRQAEFNRREEAQARRAEERYRAAVENAEREEAARQTRAQARRAEQARQAAEQIAREEEAARLEAQRRRDAAQAERERTQQEMARRQAEFLRKQSEDAAQAAKESGNSDKPECSICYEAIDAQRTKTTVPGITCRCTQPTTYHAGCIDGWVNQQGTCPVCQSGMKL